MVLHSFCAVPSCPAGLRILPGRRKLDTSVTEASVCYLKGVWSHGQEKENHLDFASRAIFFLPAQGCVLTVSVEEKGGGGEEENEEEEGVHLGLVLPVPGVQKPGLHGHD